MNDFAPFFIILILLAICFNLLLTKYSGGIKNNVFNIFIIISFSYYLVLTPSVYYFTGETYAGNVDVASYFGTGLFQIFMHVFLYSLGYYLFLKKKPVNFFNTSINNRKSNGKKLQSLIILTFIFLYATILINTISAGINVLDIVRGSFGESTVGLKGSSYFLQNFADSLISMIIIAYYFKIPKKYFLLMLIFSIPLFIILGFRYRILLTFFGIIIIYLYDNRIRPAFLLKIIFTISIFFFVLMFLTTNKYWLGTQQFDKVSYDPTTYNYDAFLDQAKGSVIDFSLYKSVDNNTVTIDYGLNMFVYVFIKIIPASYFPGGEKPYPPPQIVAIDNAIQGDRSWGEAVTCIGSAFFAYSYPGIYVFAFLMGMVVAHLQNRSEKNIFSFLQGCLITLALFQWITRGYFPQFVDHFIYLLFPIFFMKMFYSKKARLNTPQIAPPTV